MAGNIKGIIVEIGGDTSGLQNALKKVNSSTASLSKELRGINSLLKLDPKNTELVSQKQTVLKKSIEETSEKLKQLRNAQEEADRIIAEGGEISEENYRNLQREIILTENKLKELKLEASKWTQAGRSIEEFGKKVENISNKIDKMGTTLTTRLTLPIVGFATYAVKSFSEVDNGADIVISKTGAVGDAAKELEEVYKKVSGNVVGEFNDIGNAVGEISTRFEFTGDVLQEASEKFMKFAKINNTDVNTAVQKVSRYMGDASIEASKYEEILDQLSAAAQVSGISVDSLAETCTKYGAPMRALGLDTKESIAIFAGWEKAGVNTEIAFSGMKKAISNWGKAGKDSSKEFKKTLEEIKKAPSIAKATSKAIEVFGAKAGPDLADAIQGGRFEYEKFLNVLESSQGTLENTYNGVIDEADDVQLAMKKMKVQASEVGQEILKTLVPTAQKVLDSVSKLISDYNKLDDKSKKQIRNMVLLAAAIGPTLKAVGSLGKGISTTVKGIGTFSQAMGVMKTGMQSANASANTLANGLSFFTSPAGIATMAIMATAGAVAYLAYKQTEGIREAEKFAKEIANQKQEFEEYNKKIDDATNANLAQINSVSKLKDELKTLVDENGKVKEGYEGRVSFILNQLNDALGTEYKLNGDIVQSYKDLQSEIDATIEKKKAEIKLNASKQKFENAFNTETEAVNKQKEALDKLGMSYEEAKEKYGDWVDKYNSKKLTVADIEITQAEYNKRVEIAKTMKAYEDEESVLKQCTEDKKAYENDYALFMEGKYNEIGKTVVNTTKNWGNSSIKELQNSISQEKEILTKYKEIHERTGSEVAQQQMQQAQENLQNLANELASRTTTIDKLGVDEVQAWKTLANTSFEEYKSTIEKMAPEMQQKIQETTGVIISDTEMAKASSNKAYETTKNFEDKLKLGDRTKIEINNVASKMNSDTTIGNAAENLGNDVDSEFNNKLDGWTWACDLIKNIYNGLTNQNSKNLISSGASTIGGIIKSILGFSLPERGPLSDFDKSMPDMIDLMSKGINNNKSKVLNSAEKLAQELNKTLSNDVRFPLIQDFGKLQGGLSQKIANATTNNTNNITVQFYPQKMTDSEIERTFKYIDKRYGQYMS